MKPIALVFFVLAGAFLLPAPSSAGEFFPSHDSLRATLIGYYKVIRPKIKPEDEAKKAEEKKDDDKDKTKPKKKHRKRRRSGPSLLNVDPVAPQKEMGPTLVPQYDTRPDTGPRD